MGKKKLIEKMTQFKLKIEKKPKNKKQIKQNSIKLQIIKSYITYKNCFLIIE